MPGRQWCQANRQEAKKRWSEAKAIDRPWKHKDHNGLLRIQHDLLVSTRERWVGLMDRMGVFMQRVASLNKLNYHMHLCLASLSSRLRINHSLCYNSLPLLSQKFKALQLRKIYHLRFQMFWNKVQRTNTSSTILMSIWGWILQSNCLQIKDRSQCFWKDKERLKVISL